jgi:predicted nucleic-acid-binding protein
MIAIDTNILVRFLTNDDASQAIRAAKLIEEHPVLIPKTVFLETEWVLRYAYKLNRAIISAAFEKTLGLDEIRVEDIDVVTKAIFWYKSGLDFADALHLSSSHQAKKFASFDRNFVKQVKKIITESAVMLI